MAIRTIAVFTTTAAEVAAWSCSDGIVSALSAMGYCVINCGNPQQSSVPFDKFQHADLVLLSGLEWYAGAIDECYGAAWAALKAPKVAWYQESFQRDDLDFDYASIAHIADRHYFPAVQDAEAHGGHWLPFGVDTTLFAPKPVVKLYDAAFLGLLYDKRAQYIQRIKYPIFHLRTAFDKSAPAKSIELLAEAYNSVRILINLPSLSRLLVTKVTEVLACRTMLVTPKIDHPSAQGNLQQFEDGVHLIYYNPDRPEDLGEIIEYYLNHVGEREAIAEAGWREVIQRHSLRQRLQLILDDIAGRPPAAEGLTVATKPVSVPDGTYYLVSYHSTILHIDHKAGQVRHAPYDAERSTLFLEVKGNQARLITADSKLGSRRISIDPATAQFLMCEPGTHYDFNLEKVANESLVLRVGEFYLSADSDGIVRNDRKICREWEEYRLIPTMDERPCRAAGIGRTTASLPDVSLINDVTGRFLVFDAPGGKPAACSGDSVSRTLAARLLGDTPPGTIVDVGAGSGGFTIPIAKRFSRSYTVLSFEVQRIVFYQLCGNIVANSLANVFPHNVGLSDVTGFVEIPICDYRSDPTGAHLSIDPAVRRSQALAGLRIPTAYQLERFARADITTLDSFGITDVRLIRLDVEGVELNVLRGARQTIAASGYPPILFASRENQVLPLRESAHIDLLAELDGLSYEVTAFGAVRLAQHRDSKIDINLLY